MIESAYMFRVSQNCLDAAYPGAYEWLGNQIYGGQVGIDLDVMNRPDYDYARGYWVAPSLRYQYDNMSIYLAQQITNDEMERDVAITLVHETAHEFGEDDEGMAESMGRLCLK